MPVVFVNAVAAVAAVLSGRCACTPASPRRVGASVCTLVVALALLLGGTGWVPARADTPDYDSALDAWLHGDEGEALTDLAALARAGDGRARLLLGVIDKTPSLQGPWLSRLPRAERMAVMRAPGGLSGETWLALADDQPVASLWLQMLQVEADLDVVRGFSAHGEERAARLATLLLAARERLDLGESWPDWLDLELAWIAWSGASESLRASILEKVPLDHPQRYHFGADVAPGALENWLATSRAAAPLRAVCQESCPDSMASCVAAAYGALNDHGAVLAMGSPAEVLIPQAEFMTTPRGRRSVLRRILMSTNLRGRSALIDQARHGDACFGELLLAENASYRYVREGAMIVDAD